MPRPTAVTRAEFDALALAVDRLAQQLEGDRAMRKENHAMLMGFHTALIEPEPGQTKGLLHRMAAVTIDIESGQRVGRTIVRLAGVVSAIGAIAAGIWAFVRLGHLPEKGG